MFKKRHPKVGARPGTLVIAESAVAPKLSVMHFDSQEVREEEVTDLEKLWAAHDEQTITWICVQGLGDEAAIRRIGEIFSLHPLVMEDVTNVPQRPKAELYDDQFFLTSRLATFSKSKRIDLEQVSIILGKNYVITFQERYGDLFDPIRKRIRNPQGRMRQYGASYLAYALFDTVIDAYYPALEKIGDYLEHLEDQILQRPTSYLLRRLNRIKNELLQLRRAIWTQREAALSLAREPNPMIEEEVRVYLRDTYDHCIQTAEVAEMYRDMTSGLMNTYLSAISNRTNDVMKVLAIVATIFIPPTFVAGVYGMNFEYLPEKNLWWGYPVTLLVMLSMMAGMLFYFRLKGWIGQEKPDRNGNGNKHKKPE
ncbi:MAG: magnesium/cobalt transporter CorA [Planctomycetia bacterium]|jgi:magnesium transporter